MHTAFEGYLKYPKYDEFCDGQPKNVQETRHLHIPGKDMTQLYWELSMRGEPGGPKKKVSRSSPTSKSQTIKSSKMK